MARLKTRYNDELKAQLQETLAVKNVMDIPRITKITINMGVGAAAADKNSLMVLLLICKLSLVKNQFLR